MASVGKSRVDHRRRGVVLWRTAATAGAFAALAAVGGASAPIGALDAQSPPPCEQPYRQILVERNLGRGPTDRERVVVWPRRGVAYPERSTGVDVDLQSRWRDEGVDTDGDGRADVISGEIVGDEQIVVVTRGDGSLRLSQPDHALGSMESATIGDLDADGRDELLVLARPVDGGTDRYFVLLGTAPAGDQVLSDVSVEVAGNWMMGVGDQGGGRGDDLVVRAGDLDDPDDPAHLQTLIVSGEELVGAGPRSVGRLVPVVEPYEGFPMAVVDLGDERPAVISGLPWDATDPTFSIRGLVLNRSGVLTRFELSEPFDSQPHPEYGSPPRFSHATAVLYSFPRRALHLELGGSDRGGSIRAVWSIDEPCTELPVAGVPPGETGFPAAPAQPVAVEPSYTG